MNIRQNKFTASLVKIVLLVTLLTIWVSCDAKKETEFTAESLNLKGDIKRVIEHTGDRTWTLEFKDNRLLSVKEDIYGASTRNIYQLQYDGGKLTQIYSGANVVSLEVFANNFAMRLPLYGYHNADSLVRNEFGDIVQVFFKDATPHEYRLQYTYDQFNNWISRELFIDQTNSPKERTDRTILYYREVGREEIADWSARLDSIFWAAKGRNQLVASIDQTIEKNHSKLKALDSYITEKYDSVKATENEIKILVHKFETSYGGENLSAELKVIKDKLTILRGITLRERFLWYEASLYIPLLINGKKSVNDLQEPFTDRYTLTYSLELIDAIKKLEKEYMLKSIRP